MVNRSLVNSAYSGEVNSTDVSDVINAFVHLLTRQWKVDDHMIRIEFPQEIKITQRRVPLQSQKSFQKQIKCLLLEQHIEKIHTLKDKVFVQSPLVTAKKK